MVGGKRGSRPRREDSARGDDKNPTTPPKPRGEPSHVPVPALALELVLSVVDDTTAMEVVEALRHAPELLHALGGAVADVQARFARWILPALQEVRDLAPHCYYTFWDSAHGDRRGLRIGPRALRLLQMSTVGPQVHAESAHVVADCFQYMSLPGEIWDTRILQAVKMNVYSLQRLRAVNRGLRAVIDDRVLCLVRSVQAHPSHSKPPNVVADISGEETSNVYEAHETSANWLLLACVADKRDRLNHRTALHAESHYRLLRLWLCLQRHLVQASSISSSFAVAACCCVAALQLRSLRFKISGQAGSSWPARAPPQPPHTAWCADRQSARRAHETPRLPSPASPPGSSPAPSPRPLRER